MLVRQDPEFYSLRPSPDGSSKLPLQSPSLAWNKPISENFWGPRGGSGLCLSGQLRQGGIVPKGVLTSDICPVIPVESEVGSGGDTIGIEVRFLFVAQKDHFTT